MSGEYPELGPKEEVKYIIAELGKIIKVLEGSSGSMQNKDDLPALEERIEELRRQILSEDKINGFNDATLSKYLENNLRPALQLAEKLRAEKTLGGMIAIMERIVVMADQQSRQLAGPSNKERREKFSRFALDTDELNLAKHALTQFKNTGASERVLLGLKERIAVMNKIMQTTIRWLGDNGCYTFDEIVSGKAPTLLPETKSRPSTPSQGVAIPRAPTPVPVSERIKTSRSAPAPDELLEGVTIDESSGDEIDLDKL